MTEGCVCLLFTGVIVDELSGLDEAARIRFLVNDDWTLNMGIWTRHRYSDHRFPHPTKARCLHVIQDRCFGVAPDGELLTVRDPVNFDGTPRNKLIDRWHHQRRHSEALAAD